MSAVRGIRQPHCAGLRGNLLNADTMTNTFDATNLLITDTLPISANYVSGGMLSGEVISWTIGSLGPLTSTTVPLVVTATQTLTNSDYTVSAAGGLSAIGQAAIETEVLDFTADPLTGTVPLTVTFTNLVTPTEMVTNFIWAYGNGITGTTSAMTHTHTYTQAGVYTVTLTALGPSSSLILTKPHYITVTSPISVAFAAAPLTGTAPLTVTFVNSSTGASTYLWTYGDSLTGTISAVTHTHIYTQPGLYTVTLTAESGGGSQTLTRTAYIAVSEPNTRVTQDLQALYTFAEGQGTTINDVSNVGTPLDLTFAESSAAGWIPGGGLYLYAPAVISSTGAATKVISAAKASGEITLEAWLKPQNASQTGPANIVSLSEDTDNCNVTLGQLAEQYDVRLRTTTTDDNGEPSLTTSGGVLTNTLTHVVYTRDAGGTARLYLDEVEVISDTVSGSFSNWDDDYRLLLANELTGDRPWTGELYLVAVYSRALSQAEVSQNFSVKPETGPTVVVTTEVISPTGGVITSTDGLVTLDFAPGAVTETLNIDVIQQQMSQTVITATAAYSAALLPPPDGLPFKIIDLTAWRPGEDEVLEVQFQAPVTLTYHYSITEVNLIPEDSLQFFYYNLAEERLDPLPTTVQTETLQMSSVITHFSSYGVGGDSMVSIAPTIDAFEVALSRGTASYSYDIPLPAGPNGFGPKLTLQYNSGLVNSLYEPKPARGGWVGTGWTLELGEITDVGNYYLDSDNPVQRLKMSYGLTLNGLSEQIKVTKNDGVLSYGTEHQTFMVIEKISEPPWVDRHGWILTDTEGTTYYFGNDGSSGSRITHYGGTQQHGCYPTQEIDKLYKVVDRHGNTMEIDYYQPTTVFQCGGMWLEEVTESYIEEIRYTTNGSDNQAEYVINFETEDINGYKLLNIRVYHVVEGLIRRINFGYDIRPESTPLTALTIFDAQDNENNPLPPTTFGYTDRKVGRSWEQNTCGGETHGACGWTRIKVYESRPFLTTADNNQGGQLKYEYEAEPFSGDTLFPLIKRRHITDTVGGVNGTYTYSFAAPRFVPIRKTELEGQDNAWYSTLNYGRFFGFGGATVADPQDNLTKHYYNNDYNYDVEWEGPTWLNGYETETWFYGPTGQDLYSASLFGWDVYYNGAWPPKTRFVSKLEEYQYVCDGKSTDGTNNRDNLAGCVRQRTKYMYEKDNTGNLVKQEEYARNDQRYRYTDYTYASNNGHNLISLPSSQTLRANDGSKVAETRFYYDGQSLGAAATEGNLTRQEVWAGSLGYVYTDYGQYDAYGNVGSTTTYSGYEGGGTARTTTTVYDDQGLLPLTVTNPLSQVISTTYDYRFQVPETETDPNDEVTIYDYDEFGRLIAVTLPGSSGPTFKAEYHNYNGSQPYHEVTQQCLQNCASSSDYVSTYVYYDGLGRKLQARTQGDGAQYIVSDVKYDALGQVVRTAVPYAQSGSAYTTPGWSAFTLTGYDPLGRTISVQQPDGAETVTDYDLYETTVVDPNDHVKVSEQDEFGRLVKVKEFSGTSGSPMLYGTTTYDYDEQDNLIEVTDAANNPTTITYDPLSRKTSMDDPDMGQWYYKYDAAGNLTAQVDARARATHLYYDKLDRLRGKTYNPSVGNPAGYSPPTDPGSGNYTIEYQYDQTGSTHGAGVGRRTHMIDLAGTVDWFYDERGRVLTETRTFTDDYDDLDNSAGPTDAYATGYRYNEADWVTQMIYPDGEVVTTGYTDRGLPTTLRSNILSLPGPTYTTYIEAATYNALADMTSRTAGNGLTTTYSYYTAAEDNNRLKTVEVGSSLLDLTYHYDAAGNITGLDDDSTSAGGETLTFTYDHLDRLTSAGTNGSVLPQFSETYAYNNIGNLTARNGQSYSYPGSGQPRPHAVTAVGSDSYGYDENGNMTTRTEEAITYGQTWTYENKLERVTWVENGQAYTTTFVYDGDDNRLLKIEEIPSGEETVEITTVYIGQMYEEQFVTGGQAQASVDEGTAGEVLVRAESGKREAWSGEREAESGERRMESGEREDAVVVGEIALAQPVVPLTVQLSRLSPASAQTRPADPPAAGLIDHPTNQPADQSSHRTAGLASPLLVASLPLVTTWVTEEPRTADGANENAPRIEANRAADESDRQTPVQAMPLAQLQTKTWTSASDFRTDGGEVQLAQRVDRYDQDGSLTLLTLNDEFQDNELNLDRWQGRSHAVVTGLPTEQNNRLENNDESFWVETKNAEDLLAGDFEIGIEYGLTSAAQSTTPRLALIAHCQNGNFALIQFGINWVGGLPQYRLESWLTDGTNSALRADVVASSSAMTGALFIERQDTTWTLSYNYDSSTPTTLLDLSEDEVDNGSFGDCHIDLQGIDTADPQTNAFAGYFDDVTIYENDGIVYVPLVGASLTPYASTGTWRTEVDGGFTGDMAWKTLRWNSGSKPSGTGVTFKARGCTGNNGGGTCSGWQSSSMNVGGTFNLNTQTLQNYRYLQVEVELSSNTNNSETPRIDQMSLDYGHDTTAPPIPTMTPEPEYTAGLNNTVEWSTVTDTGVGGVEYQAQRAITMTFTSGISSSTWQTGTSKQFTGLNHCQTYYYRVRSRDDFQNTSGWSTTVISSTQDNDTPTADSIQIEDSEWTSDDHVAIHLNNVSDCALTRNDLEMRLRNEITSTWSGWISYANPYNGWVLSANDGLKEVSVQFRDQAGHTSQIYTDTITMDGNSPQINNFVALPAVTSNTTTISATLEDASPISWALAIRQGDGSGGSIVASTSGSGSTVNWPWNGSGETQDDYTAVLTATDSAGTEPSTDTLVIILDKTPPDIDNVYKPGTLQAWDVGEVYTTAQTTLPTRGLREIDNQAGQSEVDLVEVWRTGGVTVTASLEPVGGTDGFSATLTDLLTDTLNIINIRHHDEAGHQTTVTRGVYVDTSQPYVTNFSPTGPIGQTQPTLSGQFVSPGGSAIVTGSVVITLDNKPVNNALITPGGFSAGPAAPLSNGGHQVSVSLENEAGNLGQTDWSFTVDSLTQVTLLSPADGAIFNSSPITVSGQAEAGAVITLTVNSSPVATLTVPAGGDFSFSGVSLNLGSNNLTVLATDSLGNVAQASHTVSYVEGGIAVSITADPTTFAPNAGLNATTNFQIGAAAPDGDFLETWRLQIVSGTQVVSTSTGLGRPPDALPWDGRDTQNNLPGLDVTYDYSLLLTTTLGLTAATTPKPVSLNLDPPDQPQITVPAGNVLQGRAAIDMAGTAPGAADGDVVVVWLERPGEAPLWLDETEVSDEAWAVSQVLLNSDDNVLWVTVTDEADQESVPSDPVTVTVKVLPPLKSIDRSPFPAGLSQTLLFTATARGEDGSGLEPTVRVTADFDAPGGGQELLEFSSTNQTALTSTWTVSRGLTDFEGLLTEYDIGIEGEDGDGNRNTSYIGLRIDGLAPGTPRFIDPNPGVNHAVSTSTYRVKGEADPGSQVDLFIDGQPAGTTVAGNNEGLWELDINLSSGSNALTAQAQDDAGNLSPVSGQVILLLDTDPPQVSAQIEPLWQQTSQPLTATAVVTEAGPLYSGYVQTHISGPQSFTYNLNPNGEVWQRTFSGGLNGVYTATVSAQDQAGNFAFTPAIPFIVDSVPPDLTLSVASAPPYSYAVTQTHTVYYGEGSGTFTVTALTADPLVGLGTVTFPDTTDTGTEFQLNGAASATRSHVYTFTQSDSFSATVTVTATDRAGNEPTQPFALLNDTIAPTAGITVPSSAGLNVPVTWAGQDDLSGIRHYDVQVKEGANGDWTGWLSQTIQTQSQFIGTKGYSYTFRIRATDNVSNTAQTWQESQPVTINAVTKYYTHGGQRVAMRQGDVVYYLSGDHLGSTSLTTDQDQNIVSEVRYLPYGQERWTNGSTPTDFGFTSQRNEAGFGLMDYNARYYNPRLGRFVSPDSLVPNPIDSQAFNRYAYVNNNPVNHTDPSGHGCPVVCMYQEVTVGGGGSGGTGANPISVGETGGGGEVIVTGGLVLTVLAMKAAQTLWMNVVAAPDIAPQPGISGDELNPSDSGGIIPGPPSDGEFTGPWVSSGPAELQQPNNPPGFPADSGIPPMVASEARKLGFQGGFSRRERRMIEGVVRKYGLDLTGVKLWRAEGGSDIGLGWVGENDLIFHDDVFGLSGETMAEFIRHELKHKEQGLTEWGVGIISDAEEEARQAEKHRNRR